MGLDLDYACNGISVSVSRSIAGRSGIGEDPRNDYITYSLIGHGF